MSLNFAGLSPHPPIIIPEIARLQSPERSDGGQGNEDLIKVADTTVALRKLAHTFREAEIDTLIVITPHGLVFPDKFSISTMRKNFGTMARFDAPNVTLEYDNDLDLAAEILKASDESGVPVVPYDNNGEFYELDHGIMVPLYYLRREQETGLKILPITYSDLDRTQHFAFGQTLGEVARNYSGRVGILASGDLSHQLIQNPETKKMDEKLITDLKESNIQNILYYDEEMVENWSECGYRSVLILLGALDGLDAKAEILSYEGPFGVGYLVANYSLPFG